jgi:RNA polymerase sigma-70 factor (ECF subfamily)
MRGYKAMNKFKDEQPFKPWILRIAVNQALTTMRKIQRRRELPTQTSGADFDLAIDESLIDRERAALLIAALNQMKERERIVIYLKYFMDFNEKELAHYLGCAQGTVKSRLHRALAKLREVVVDAYPQLLEEPS